MIENFRMDPKRLPDIVGEHFVRGEIGSGLEVPNARRRVLPNTTKKIRRRLGRRM
jgi:hypothetical protein